MGRPVSHTGGAGYDNGSSLATDGNMRNGAWNIGPKATSRYRQVDIGGPWPIDSLRVWHELSDSRRIRYKDVVFRISTTADFSSDVTTVFNNDLDNSLGLGAGTDGEYDETESGKIVHFPQTRARYIRLHTFGNNHDDQNRLLEVMVGQRASLNRAPTAQDTWVTTPANTALTYDLSPLAFDPDGDNLEWSVGPATNGTVGLQYLTGGSVIYTPNAGFVGIDSFTYTVTDSHDATATGTITVAVGAALLLNLNVIAGDGTVNIEEKATGFAISGDTGSEGGVTVTVTVGTTPLTATSAAANPATWSVTVPGNASHISEPSVAVEVNASKTGFDAARAVQSTLAVDLTAPTAPAYTAPGSLQFGVAISAISPSGGSGIAEYGAPACPRG